MVAVLQDKEFLANLLQKRNRTIYVKITALDLDLQEKDEIYGYATDGSINIDGASAVRRSCNLTLVSENINIKEYNWALNTRFRLEIGVKNNTSQYTNKPIIWFPQGVYVITQFSAALSTSGYTISISGQDKMCLLSGEVSGLLTAETDFGKYEEVTASGDIVVHDLTLREIITSLVHTYALEPLDNIDIELPDESGYNLLTYRGQSPMYILRDTVNQHVQNYTTIGTTGCCVDGTLKTIATVGNYWKPAGLNSEDAPIQTGDTVTFTQGLEYYVQKVEYGELAGYEETPLTFAGELKASAGEAATSILDKIKNMFGDFEYGYDIDGRFFFRKKKTYLKSYMNDTSAIEAFTSGEYSFEFKDLSMFTSFNNNPDIKNLKNDFTVWGEYKTASGAALPIHMRVAIDNKPITYVSYWQNKTYYTINSPGDRLDNDIVVDWRELIYQMAIDYQAHHLEYDYAELLEVSNPDFVKNGRTGYEQYYTDILGFWRLLYEPNRTQAIKSWARVAANDLSVSRFYYTEGNISNEMADFTSDEYKNHPYNTWHTYKNNYRMLWYDSIDLAPSNYPIYYSVSGIPEFDEREKPASIRRLYQYNSATKGYNSIMRRPLLETAYYVRERDIETGTLQDGAWVNLANSTSWGIMDNLDKLWLKNGRQSIPLMVQTPANALPLYFQPGLYKEGLYCHAINETEPRVYSGLIYYASVEKGSTVESLDSIRWYYMPDCSLVKRAFQDTKGTVYLYNKNSEGEFTEFKMVRPYEVRAYVVNKYVPSMFEGYT